MSVALGVGAVASLRRKAVHDQLMACSPAITHQVRDCVSVAWTEYWSEGVGHFFHLVVTDAPDERGRVEMEEIERRLGHPIAACVVKRDDVDRPHACMSGSSFTFMLLSAKVVGE